MNITRHTTDNNCGKPFLELCGAEKMPHEIAAAEKESLSSAFRHLSNIANVPLGELVDIEEEAERLDTRVVVEAAEPEFDSNPEAEEPMD